MPKELHAVHDSRGVIIAASIVDRDNISAAPVPIPQPGEGTAYALIALEGREAEMALDLLCTTFRIDPTGKRLIADIPPPQAEAGS
ncbi:MULTISPECIES: hypothetical protein [Sphingomonadales]|uniref:Uncharacterized protein n=2 Tax=Edaphosphingomonas TaxID=3423724 RepID=A0A2T4HW42_9SPHN|nr:MULTISPECIES: hypothetical protein [Sphingomonas]AGH48637.1 hypothetical protein G432_04550 [Sphingomonas sp. MM-1]MDX3885630.1 hypothetical protein [Sphingomonas sp.]OHT21115.1 hypothetical protein BHE75_03120 [Sphingomonas haloaromaticamans]PTD20005.1 hypothetical protein CV103_12590 [Sphingomonas fennica]